MRAEKGNFPIAFMCRHLEVTRSGYYAWCRRPTSARVIANRRLLVQVRTLFEENLGRAGSPRIWRELQNAGQRVGRHRIARLMRDDELYARRKRRFVVTTDSCHSKRVAPNVLNRDFKPAAMNRAWGSDITYVQTRQGWLYLAVVLDLFSRRIVGWAMSCRIDTALTLSALEMAIAGRIPGGGLVHHSDRGVQYACDAYRETLQRHQVLCSMSRKANCWDNAVVESFFGTLKVELVHDADFHTREEARKAIFEYIETYYNRRRLHSSLDYRSPVEYERLAE